MAIKSFSNISFADNGKVVFGASDDMKISHDGTQNLIESVSGNLKFLQNANDGDIIFQSDDGSGGVATYLTIDGSAGNMKAATNMRFSDSKQLQLGDSGDLTLQHDGSASYISNAVGNVFITQNANDGDIFFKSDNGAGGTATYFQLDGSLATHDGSATTALSTVWPDNSKIIVGAGADGRFWHNGTDTYLQNTTGDLVIQNFADDKDIILKSDDGSGGTTTYLTVDGSSTNMKAHKNFYVVDDILLGIGSGFDMRLYHDGSNSFLRNDTGNLTIFNNTNDGDIIFQSDDGSGGIQTYLTIDGGLEVVTVPDTIYLGAGTSFDLSLRHDGSNSHIQNNTGNLTIKNASNDSDIIFQSDDGSGGLATYLTLDGGLGYTTVQKRIKFDDNVQLQLGSDGDLQFYHTGSVGVLYNNTGDFTLRQNADDKDIVFQCDDGSGGVETYFFLDGSAGGASPVTKFPDGSRLQFGSGGDSTMNHDGSNFTISTSTGSFIIKCNTDDDDIKLQSDNGSGGTTDYLICDGSTKTVVAKVPVVHEEDSSIGWHGSVTRVKILPSDFQPDSGGRPVMISLGTNEAHLFSNGSSKMFASIPIPTGFKATHVKIHGSDTGQNFSVHEANIANKTTVEKGSSTPIEDEVGITEVESTTTNYILIIVESDGTTDEIHGGYMTIAKV